MSTKLFLYNRNLRLPIIFGHLIWLPAWHIRLAELVRGLFPSFWMRGLRCCDHGGQVMRWIPVFAWNRWHLTKMERDDWGDGSDAWSQISIREFARQVRR